MARQIRTITPADLPAVATFLRASFHAPPDARFADPDVLRWKYLQEGPSWEGSRAYVMEMEGRIIAHAGLCPARLVLPRGDRVSSLTIIDWAADRAATGAGILIYRHLMALAETTFLIRGTETTRAIAPKLGFTPVGDVLVYSRWLRPVREFMERPKNKRSFLRLAHGLLRLPFLAPKAPPGWDCVSVPAFDERLAPILAFRPSGRGLCERTLGSLNHMLACPLAEMKGYLVRQGERIRGYVVLAHRGWEARVVDVALDSEKLEDWVAAYSLATAAAARDPGVCRIRAMAAPLVLRNALRRTEFWENEVEPLSLFDPKARVPADQTLDIQYFESDSAYT